MARKLHDTPIPLVTVSGYLGAGKTTLINQIVRSANDRRFVIFVNDFGKINIDLQLVETVKDDRISFSNGCVCCTLNDDFVSAVVNFANLPDQPDGILVEASGVSNPRALDMSLRALEAAGHVRIDTTVYVIDADQFGQLDYVGTETIVDHAVANDLVLINKTDLITVAHLADIEETLAIAAPYTRVHPTTQCNVPPEILFGSVNREADRFRTTSPHRHQPFFRWDLESDELVDRESFWVLVKLLQARFLRSKGLVRFQDAPDVVHILNAVGQRALLQAAPSLSPEGPAMQLVGINPNPIEDLDYLNATCARMFGRCDLGTDTASSR